MFFKKLELFGFKSFAQKTKLDFEAGVTAVVGPNGCGKSNIADSIKWVLGEQSVRSMRGARMEDVIFHGADNISPVGLAEVSLTISNQNKFLPLDYEEITLTRRIFRSGESEYLINKIPVRLKDITELLMGTGLGMPSYSLMEQGQVDQILSSRPEDRRAIFEEASGITKYKSKKEEALRRLERTQENLQRIGDIIVEVKRQIKSMERQVNKARRYKQEFERLKEYELNVSQFQYQNFKKEKRELENKIKELEKEEASSRLSLTSHTLSKTRQELSLTEENISRIKEESYEVCAAIKTANNEIALDEERIEELTRRNEDLLQQIQSLEGKIVATSEQIKVVQDQIETIKQKKQAKATLLTEKEEETNNILADIKEAQKKIAEDKTQEVEIIAQQARLKNDLTKLEANLAIFNARLRRLNVERERTEQDVNNIEEEHKVCAEELESLNEQLEQLTKEVMDLKNNLGTKLDEKEELEQRLEDINRRITLLHSKLNFLKEITKKYEGCSNGVKAILSAKSNQTLKIEGLCDIVANLIEVSPRYQLSIEMALGEFAQAIVVENTQAAQEAIDYLRKRNLGRASFLCLDSLNSGNSKDIKLPQTLGKALGFVKVEPKYQKLLECLLADIFIVRDLKRARQLFKNLVPGVRLVTLNGEILTSTLITGGSLPKDLDSSLLGRRERIAQTELELERTKKEKTDIENLQVNQQSEIKEITNLIQQREPVLNKLKLQLADKENKKANIKAERKRFQDELSLLKLEINETNEQIEQLRTDQENLNQEILNFQERENQLQQNIENHQNLIAEKNQEKQNRLIEIAEVKTQLSALDREAEDTDRRLKMFLESESEQQATQKARKTEQQYTATKIEKLKRQIKQLKLRDKDLSQAKLNVEEKLNRTLEQHRKLSATMQGLEEEVRKSQKGLDEVREKRANLQVSLTELNYKQSSLKDKMYQSYLVDLEATLEDALEISSPETSVFDEINRLKTKLEGMGPVNLVAIEENDQLQQRYSFLISQQEDLVRAQESLRKAISQINRTARTKFLETFQMIQSSFKEYFRILFGGGDSRLILLDENNILESGIEIVVRPPGKRLQNISLLSGGEKALIAIALLFAIFKVKPSPFCILDEVDAPLDEANIDRFTNLLSEFIKTSQFIIITHNKRTINMADIMYGITMEKSGVSKIVSVRFSDEKETPAREMVQAEN